MKKSEYGLKSVLLRNSFDEDCESASSPTRKQFLTKLFRNVHRSGFKVHILINQFNTNEALKVLSVNTAEASRAFEILQLAQFSNNSC